MAKGLSHKLVQTTGVDEIQKPFDVEVEPFINQDGLANTNIPVNDQKKKRQEDALALAQLIYDVFVDENKGHTIINGQTDANTTTSN
jgi:hypothetical protein